METSAARNAGLPLVQRGKTPFIYTSFYEGRSCNPYLYVNAWVPEQQVPPIVDHFMKANNAKSFFLIGSDYAFGRGMLQFTRAYIEKQGGKVVGEEYLPMDGSDWTPILSKLRSSGADALVTSTAGGAPNVTLTKQLRAAIRELRQAVADGADPAAAADVLERLGKELRTPFEKESKISSYIFQTEDAKEGPKAFAEKRKPVWQAR